MDPRPKPSSQEVEVYELSMVNDKGDGGDFLFKPGRPIRGVAQIEVVQTFVTGVPLTSGVPDHDWFDVSVAGFAFNSLTNTPAQNALRLYNTGERTRTEQANRVVMRSRNTMGDTITDMRMNVFRPDGSRAQAGDFGRIVFDLRITTVAGSRL